MSKPYLIGHDKLTAEEIERYRPYHEMTAFELGYWSYGKCDVSCPFSADSVDGQAWDRGAECAMRRTELKRYSWGDELAIERKL